MPIAMQMNIILFSQSLTTVVALKDFEGECQFCELGTIKGLRGTEK